ncbi:MAG: VWA domain-containing protein [Pseudomonadota bacterium]
MITLLWPFILLLLPLPWLIRRLAPAVRRERAALRVPFFTRWAALVDAQGERRAPLVQRFPMLALWLLWLLLLLATARPIWIGEAIELPNSGRDLMLAVDISGSMRVDDMRLSNGAAPRIDVVKVLGAEFMSRRSGDRLGLILFASRAYLQSPLSFDTDTVTRFLQEAQIGFAGQETAIGDAIGLAAKRLKERPQSNRVLILLTDGQDTASTVDPMEAARLAGSLGIKIYTIGIGADSMTLPGLLGSPLGARTVNPSSDLDEGTLSKIAEVTNGQYFRARDPAELAKIYDIIEDLEPLEVETATYRPQKSLLAFPLLGAVFMSFVLVVHRLFVERGATTTRRVLPT